MDYVSQLQASLAEGRFVLTADLLPPKGPSLDGVRDRVACLKDKVTAVNVADMPSAVLAQSAWAACVALLQAGIEPVLQVTCRDRNILALQADLLGAHAMGVRNVLALTGDHVSFGDHPGTKPVFDVSATQLLHVVRELNRGSSAAGTPLAAPCHFFAGAATNPVQNPIEPQLFRTLAKANAGAEFFQTQPLFLPEQWSTFMAQMDSVGVTTPVLAGTFLLESPGMARFMDSRVPGVQIPESVLQGIAAATDPKAYGRALVKEFIEAVHHSGAVGVHLMTHNRYEEVAALSDELDLWVPSRVQTTGISRAT